MSRSFTGTQTASGSYNDLKSQTSFNDDSTADTTAIFAEQASSISFYDSSSAGSGNYLLFGYYMNGFYAGSFMGFKNASDAGAAQIFVDGGAITFSDSSSADQSTIDATVATVINFQNNAQGSTAHIVLYDSFVSFADASSAGTARIEADAGSGVTFAGHSTGGTATIVTDSTSAVDFSQTTGPNGDGKVAVAALQGSGTDRIGANQLTVGLTGLGALLGAQALGGTITDGGQGGTLVTVGAVNAALVYLGGTTTWLNKGVAIATSLIRLGDASSSIARFVNTAVATLDLASDIGIAVGTNAASSLENEGVLAKTVGTGTSVVSASFTSSGNSQAQIEVQSGTLQFAGATSTFLDQAISGAGTFAIGGGVSTIGAGTSIAAAQWAISRAGTVVNLNRALSYSGGFSQGTGSTLTLTGGYLLLSGAAGFAGATVNGSQRLYAEGATTITGGLTIGGTAVFEDTKTVAQSAGTITVGDSSGSAATLFIATGGIYAIADDSGIARGTAAGSYLLNEGLFEKTGGAGTSTVAISIVDTGSVTATSGILSFTGAANSFAGAIGGSGKVIFGGGATTLKSGTTATVAGLGLAGSATAVHLAESLTYAGTFSQSTGSTLSLTGGYLLLSGAASFANATVNGTQRLYGEGATTIAGLTIGGTAVFEDTKTVSQSGGTVTVGDTGTGAAVLYNFAGAVYSITDNSGIARGTAAGSYILDQGTLQKTGGTGTSTIGLNIANNIGTAGTVGVTAGTLDLGGTLAGNLALKVGAGATLILEKSAAAGSAASLAAGAATLQLNDAQDYHGTIAGFAGTTKLDLRSIGFGSGITTTLGYSGTSTSGTLTVSDGTHTASLAMIGNYQKADFHLATDNHQGSLVTFV